MTNDLITVVTPTFGFDSPLRLSVLCSELREFTNLPFRHIVSDDGTNSQRVRDHQRKICTRHGAEWISNPGKPIYGVASNLNYLFSHVKTPWCYFVEDGVRPSLGWLEAAMDFIAKIGSKEWHGKRVGLAGFAPMYSYLLAWGKAFHTSLPTIKWVEPDYGKYSHPVLYEFYGPWNDGLWNWDRICDNVLDYCYTSPDWGNLPEHFEYFRRVMLLGLYPPHDPHDVTIHDKAKFLYWTFGAWPQRRRAYLSWYASPHPLINMDAFRAVGGFRDDATNWDNLLCQRMWKNGYLVMAVEGPPWLHLNGQGFRAFDDGMEPRRRNDHTDYSMIDYGMDTMKAAPQLAHDAGITLSVRREIEAQLEKINLDEIEGWPKA